MDDRLENARQLEVRGRVVEAFGSEVHDRAVLRAEIRRLVHALGPYRVLAREALQREAGAGRWHEAGFDRALQAAVEEGEIEELPLGFYGLPHPNGEEGPSVA